MEYYCISDVGLVRTKNQDSYAVIKNLYGDFLLLVADGIGGANAGEIASGETIDYFNKIFKDSGPFDNIDSMISFLNYHTINVNKKIIELSRVNSKYYGMGTTLTGVMISKNRYVVVNVGDSRVYGYLDKETFQLTHDHSLMNQMLDNNELTFEEIKNHPKKHYLVKAIGIHNQLEPDVHKIKKMEYLLICSDGLHGYVSGSEMNEIVNNDLNIKDKAIALKDLALLKGGYDNITVILAKV